MTAAGGDVAGGTEAVEPQATSEPAAPVVHRRADLALNHMAETTCGRTVVMVKSTQRWSDVTCGSCSRSKPEGAA